MAEPKPDPSVLAGPLPHLAFAGQRNAAPDPHARARGATHIERIPLQTQFRADDWGPRRDPFGLHWAILQPGHHNLGEVP